MAQRRYLVTLHSSGATREIEYRRDATGDIRQVDASDWDFPITGPVEAAEVEVLIGRQRKVQARLTGEQYLYLVDADSLELLLGGLDHMPARDAIDYAMAMAGIDI